MNLAIDIGNTRIKWALFQDDTLRGLHSMSADEITSLEPSPLCPLLTVLPPELQNPDHIILCATGQIPWQLLKLSENKVHRLSASSQLPIRLDYLTPETLGPDRIAAACGAQKLFCGSPCVIIDAGTCITVDYLDSTATYRGGAIMPGLAMKIRALHTFTAKLPLLQNDDTYPHPATGRNTQQSMGAGVYAATLFALQGFIGHYRSLDPSTKVVVTGGDASLLWQEGLKNIPDSIIEPHLLLMGLNEIMKQNEE